jgi:acetyltransferase
MEKFFYPKSVAVVGVSENPVNLARGIVANLLEFGYQGKIYPVGPRGGWIFGLRILSHLQDLPEPVDLAAILIPARYVPQVVEDCGKLGIIRVVVESGGFSELGEPGQALEEETRSLLRKYNLRLVGPNGLGLMNLEIGLALPFSHLRPKPRRGNLSIIAQSGGVGLHLMAWMGREGLGLNKFLSLGNKMDVAENEALAYFLQDPGTQAIYLYLEGMTDGAELLALGRQAGKPVFLHHANVGPETAGIARSHTASLATEEQVLEAACRQGGILRIRSQAEFLVGAKLAAQPPVRGSRVVVLSRSGGEAVITAYACRQWGFVLPPLSPKLAQLIEQRSRAGVIKPTNPIDLGDIFDFAVYSELMAAICRDPEVDAVLLNYGPVGESERDEARQHVRLLVELARQYGKPLAIVVVCTLDEEEFFVQTLRVPVFHFPSEAVRSLAYSRFFGQRAELPETAPPSPPLKAAGEIGGLLARASDDFLPLPQALALTAALGIAVPAWQAAASPEEAVAAAGRLGYPVALKLAAPSLVHKSEAGAVLLNLTEAGAVTAGFARLAEIAREHLPPGEPWQVLVMTMVSGGQEVLLGARRDQAFGPVLAFGAGGVATEILEDVALRVAPLNPAEARCQIAETRIGRILAGIRGQPPADLEALSQALSDLSQLMLDFPQIIEVDLNPVRTFPGKPGLLALDARIKVG